MSNGKIFKLTIPGDPLFIKVAKKAACAAGSLMDFDMEAIRDIEIAVGEACKIITCHNAQGWCENYDIVWEVDDRKVTIAISEGCGCRTAKSESRPCIDCPKEGDLGLAIIKSLMNDVEIVSCSQGNRSIKMTKER